MGRGSGQPLRALRDSEALLRLQHGVTRCLAEAESVTAAVKSVLRVVCTTRGWDCGRFFAVDETLGELICTESWGRNRTVLRAFMRNSRGLRMARGAGLAGRVWQTGKPLWVADVRKDARIARPLLAESADVHGALVFQVASAAGILGVIAISSRGVRKPEPRLLHAMDVVGRQLGEFLRRKHIEQAHLRFRAGMDASADMILLIDHQSMRYVDVNETVCRTLGYTREEMLAMGPQDVLPASREELQRTYEKFIADPSTIHGMNSVYRCRDGSTVPFESTRRLLHSEDGPIIVAISRDIRKRLETEAALRESEQRFRSLTELSADWYWEQDAALRFVGTGGHDKARGGITAAQHSGLRRWELPGTEPLEGGWEAHKAQLEARRPFRDFMLKRTGNDGSVHYVSISGEPIFDQAGAFQGYRGVARDVTQSVEAEAALRESEARFRSLTQLSSDFFWETDAQHRLVQVEGTSEAGAAQPYTRAGKAPWEVPAVKPDAAGWAAHRARFEARRPFRNFEYALLGADGRPRYYSVSGEPRADAGGRFAGFRGVGHEITDIVEAREKIAALAYSDPLTGLANRTGFGPALEHAVRRARRNSTQLAALYLDLDGFKQVNDTYGHETGDRLLIEVAARLRHTLRASDQVARFGGDEFVVVLEDVPGPPEVELVAGKLIAEIGRPYGILPDGGACRVTASVGVSLFPADADSPRELLQHADAAMYRAKQDSKNTLRFYN
jgi:diguanylate cyclase (GGDEF)-like protein/PAS domain S-box-containing protein